MTMRRQQLRRRRLPAFFYVVFVVVGAVATKHSTLYLLGSQNALWRSAAPAVSGGADVLTARQRPRRRQAIIPTLSRSGWGTTRSIGRPKCQTVSGFQHDTHYSFRPLHWSVKHPLSLLRAGGSDQFDTGHDIPSPNGPIVDYSDEQDDDEDDADGTRAAPRRRVVVLMDCFTPYLGLYVANRIKADYRNVAVVYVLSDYLRVYSSFTAPDDADRWEAARIPGGCDDDNSNSINEGDESDARRHLIEEWKNRVYPGRDRRNVEWVGAYSESDSGLDDAERLRLLLNVTCRDDPDVLPDRRHKYLMNERVRDHGGLLTARQRLCSSLSEVLDFAREELHEQRRAVASATDETKDAGATTAVPRVIVKPFRGCGTESVHLCETLEQVSEAWDRITNSTVFGEHEMHSTVLAQEFLVGVEYAVDVVARNGTYKVSAVWRYDKRPANGAPFCYFRTQLVDPESDPNVPAVTEYLCQSLRALGVRWGISHNEVIVTSDRGPVLVEVNCRQHNMDFCPITMCCIGYNALDMMVDAMLGTVSDWDKYPDLPTLQASGCMVHLVNYATGRLVDVCNLDIVAQLSSVFNMEVYEQFVSPGSMIEPTIDIKTDAGWVQLVNDDVDALERDYAEIVRLMPTMFRVE